MVKTHEEILQEVCGIKHVGLGTLIHLQDGRLAVVKSVDFLTGCVDDVELVADIKQGKAHGGVHITRSATSDDAEVTPGRD